MHKNNAKYALMSMFIVFVCSLASHWIGQMRRLQSGTIMSLIQRPPSCIYPEWHEQRTKGELGLLVHIWSQPPLLVSQGSTSVYRQKKSNKLCQNFTVEYYRAHNRMSFHQKRGCIQYCRSRWRNQQCCYRLGHSCGCPQNIHWYLHS